MKTKYLGVTAVVVAVVSLLVAGLIFTLVSFHPSPMLSDRTQTTRQLSAAEAQRLRSLEYYTQVLGEVFAPSEAISENYLAMFPERARAAAPTTSFVQRELAMVYRAPNDAYALIDNRLYREGDELPGNARLVSIESDSVWLIEAGQRRQLHVNRAGAGATPVSLVSSSHVSP